jgi:hypothetical protein
MSSYERNPIRAHMTMETAWVGGLDAIRSFGGKIWRPTEGNGKKAPLHARVDIHELLSRPLCGSTHALDPAECPIIIPTAITQAQPPGKFRARIILQGFLLPGLPPTGEIVQIPQWAWAQLLRRSLTCCLTAAPACWWDCDESLRLSTPDGCVCVKCVKCVHDVLGRLPSS